jgi:hypothetical protein
MTEQRELKIAIDFEGTPTKGKLELSHGKGLKVLLAHANLDVPKGSSTEGRQSEVIHEVQFSNMRVETCRGESSAALASSAVIRESFTVSAPFAALPSHLIGLEGSHPGVVCQDGIATSLLLSCDVDQKTLKRVADCQGWTPENLEDAYTKMAKDSYTIKVQNNETESLSPVLRAYLSENKMKYANVSNRIDSGIAGVPKEDIKLYVAKAKNWMEEIHTSSLALKDLSVLIEASTPGAGDKRIKVSGMLTVTYSTLETTKTPRVTKKTGKKQLASKKLSSKKLKHTYADDDSDSSDYSNSSDSDDGHSDSEDDRRSKRKHMSSTILKKKSDKHSRSARGARVN